MASQGTHTAALAEKPISQKEVNREYANLHRYLSEEKKKATKAGKKLIVLAGEVHNYRNSLLVDLMLLDVAKDLGIGNLVIELDEQTTHKLANTIEQKLADRDKSVDHLSIPSKTTELGQIIRRTCQIDMVRHLPHRKPYVAESTKEMNNSVIAAYYAMDMKMKLLPGDPENETRYQRVISQPDTDGGQSMIEPQYELPMLKGIRKACDNGNVVGIYGAAHAPQLVSWLNETGDIHAVGVNAKADLSFENHVAAGSIIEHRLNQMRTDFYTPNICSTTHIHPADAIGMVMKASLNFKKTERRLQGGDFIKLDRFLDSSMQPQSNSLGAS